MFHEMNIKHFFKYFPKKTFLKKKKKLRMYFVVPGIK